MMFYLEKGVGLGPRYKKYEVMLMWHHFPSKPCRSPLNIILDEPIFKLGPILSPKVWSMKGILASNYIEPKP